MHKITNQIWIGNSQDACHSTPLKEAGIDAVLNCAFDLFGQRGWDHQLHFAHCGLADGPGNPLSSYYSAILQLCSLVKLGKKILVHCHKGESRSVAVVIGYLNSEDNLGWDHWRNFIRSIRTTPDHTPHQALKSELFDKVDWNTLAMIKWG
jgi:hypothetical protein